MDKIILDKSPQSSPAYQQILAFFERQIQSGRMKPGEKIPTERDLAEELRTARGTVKKAYEELVRRGLIEASPGRGSFVAQARTAPAESRKDQAVRLIDELIDELAHLKFSPQEIRVFFDLRLLGREEDLRNLSVAVVDCNPEALAIFERQFQVVPNINLAKFLLDEVLKDAGAAKRLKSFDLILSTTTHFGEFTEKFPELRAKTVQVAVAPTRASIINLARLTPSQKIGVICESQRFLDIVLDHLKAFDIPAASVAGLFWSDLAKLGPFLRGKDAVIIPSGYSLQRDRERLAVLQEFTGDGGAIIPFDYQIERGSLLHVEERLRSLLDDEKRGR